MLTCSQHMHTCKHIHMHTHKIGPCKRQTFLSAVEQFFMMLCDFFLLYKNVLFNSTPQRSVCLPLKFVQLWVIHVGHSELIIFMLCVNLTQSLFYFQYINVQAFQSHLGKIIPLPPNYDIIMDRHLLTCVRAVSRLSSVPLLCMPTSLILPHRKIQVANKCLKICIRIHL